MTSIRDACLALEDRKAAAIGESPRMATEAEWRRLFVGLDVDFDEIYDTAWDMVESQLNHIARGDVTLLSALHGLWGDGVLTGLMLAEMRSRESES